MSNPTTGLTLYNSHYIKLACIVYMMLYSRDRKLEKRLILDWCRERRAHKMPRFKDVQAFSLIMAAAQEATFPNVYFNK